ncbi:MAG: hydantoinase/oxoprolinase family protein [Hyphomicrobium aestuarii]|nr:hydantoinase/oxoprolinase family protein [Hyphomicrobium aestuarii]
MTRVAGLDIGGANLKVAVAEKGVLTDVRQVPCALWRGVEQLELALSEVAGLIGKADDVRVTMTGELADVFPDRYTGVARIVEVVEARTWAHSGPQLRFWRGGAARLDASWWCAAEAVANYAAVASANFLATTGLVATRLADTNGHDGGMLIDIGSTTTDIVPFACGWSSPSGLTDADRLRSGELVYTGATRTPVPAVTTRGVFQGHWQTLAREPFAHMADVYRILGTLPDGVDLHATADGRGRTVADSRARLARCFGRDDDLSEDGATDAQGEANCAAYWEASARAIAEAQMQSILEGCHQVISKRPASARLVVSAGIGAVLATEAARRLGSQCIPFAEVIGVTGDLAGIAGYCAPAVALALLDAD